MKKLLITAASPEDIDNLIDAGQCSFCFSSHPVKKMIFRSIVFTDMPVVDNEKGEGWKPLDDRLRNSQIAIPIAYCPRCSYLVRHQAMPVVVVKAMLSMTKSWKIFSIDHRDDEG